MSKVPFIVGLVLTSYLNVFSQTDSLYIDEGLLGNSEIVIADSTQLWYLPVGTKIDVSVSYVQKYADSSQMIIYPYTKYEVQCGSWIRDTVFQDWKPVRLTKDLETKPDWLYNEPQLFSIQPRVKGVKTCPCGCPPVEVWKQQRVDPITGSLEQCSFIVNSTYTKDKDKFHKVLNLHYPKDTKKN